MTKEDRINKFLEKYGALVKEYEVDIIAIPQYVPDEKGGWQLKIQSQPIDLKELQKQQLEQAFISKP